MANKIGVQGVVQLPPQVQRIVYSTPGVALSGGGLAASSSAACMASPTNLGLLNKHEGSFNMAARPSIAPTAQMAVPRRTTSLPQQAQQVLARAQLPGHQQQQQQQQHPQPQPQLVAGNVMWQGSQQQVMLLPQSSGLLQAAGPLPAVSLLPSSQQQRQQAVNVAAAMGRSSSIQSNASSGSALSSSVAVPINATEVQSVAEKLGFFCLHSGAQVTITSLPDTGLAVLLSGRPDQVAMAQSLLVAARNQQ